MSLTEYIFYRLPISLTSLRHLVMSCFSVAGHLHRCYTGPPFIHFTSAAFLLANAITSHFCLSTLTKSCLIFTSLPSSLPSTFARPSCSESTHSRSSPPYVQFLLIIHNGSFPRKTPFPSSAASSEKVPSPSNALESRVKPSLTPTQVAQGQHHGNQ